MHLYVNLVSRHCCSRRHVSRPSAHVHPAGIFRFRENEILDRQVLTVEMNLIPWRDWSLGHGNATGVTKEMACEWLTAEVSFFSFLFLFLFRCKVQYISIYR